MKVNTKALKESMSDTLFGTAINFPLNYVMVAFALSMEMSAVQMTVFMTSCLFVLAVVRKYYVRVWFDKRNRYYDKKRRNVT